MGVSSNGYVLDGTNTVESGTRNRKSIWVHKVQTAEDKVADPIRATRELKEKR